MSDKFRYPNRIVDIARLWPELVTPKGRLVGRWEQMIALLERRDQALEDFLNTTGGGKDWATVVIAAANTHKSGKASADLVCDGVADEVQFQKAIDSLPLYLNTYPRGRIVLLEGDFNITPNASINCRSGSFILQGQSSKENIFPTTVSVLSGTSAIFTNGIQVGFFGVTFLNGSTGPLTDFAASFGNAIFSDGNFQVAGMLATYNVVAYDANLYAIGALPLLAGNNIETHNCQLQAVVAVFTGPTTVVLHDTFLSSSATRAIDVEFTSAGGSLLFNSSRIIGPVRLTKSGVGNVSFGASATQFGFISTYTIGLAQEAHTVELVNLDGFSYINGSTFGSFKSNTPNTFDQVHLTNTSRTQIVGNTFVPLGTLDNYRCNIKIADAGCVNNVVQANSTPGGMSGDLCDSGTSTKVFTPTNAANETLFWMDAKAASGGDTGLTDGLVWMQEGAGGYDSNAVRVVDNQTVRGIKVFQNNIGFGSSNPIKRVSIEGATDATYTSDASIDFVTEVSPAIGDYGYADFGFRLYNPANSTPRQAIWSFGAEGNLPSTGGPTGYDFYLFDSVAGDYRMFIDSLGRMTIGDHGATGFLDIRAGTTSVPPLVFQAGNLLTTPVVGAVEFDGSRSYITKKTALRESLSGVVFTQTADKSVTNTVTETSAVGTGVGTVTLPANTLIAGKTFRIRIGGVFSTPAASTPSVVIKVKYGSVTVATVTTTLMPASASNLWVDAEVFITCRTTGASGTVMTHGTVRYATGSGTIAVDPLTNAGATTTVNTTTANALDVSVQWDTATSTRIWKTTVAVVEVLN